MGEFFAIKTSRGLIPMEPQDQAEYDALAFNKPIRVKATQARSNPRNRWFHASLAVLFDMQDTWPTPTLFRNAIKRALGLCDVHEVKGQTHYEYHSIAFNKMDEKDFVHFCDRFVKLVCTRIIPNLDEQDARRMLDVLDADSGKIGTRAA